LTLVLPLAYHFSTSIAARAATAPVYFAEGFTGAGFQEYLTLLNTGPAASVTIRYLFSDGTTLAQTVPVAAQSRATVDVNAAVGPNRDVAASVSSDQDGLHVERVMYFAACPGVCVRGSHIGAGVAPSQDWYFAEGYTGSGFQEYLTLLNPSGGNTSVLVTYLFGDGSGSLQRTYAVGPNTRRTISVNAEVGANRDVAMTVHAPSPVIAERPLYFSSCVAGTCADGGTVSAGAPAPLTQWSFAEGYTGPGFQEYLTISNPTANAATVQIAYLLSDGRTVPGTVGVPGLSRRTVWVNDAVGANQSVSAVVSSAVAVVVERSLYFHACVGTLCVADGATDSLGMTPQTDWYFAEGFTGAGYQEFLTLGNSGTATAQVQVTYLFNGSQTSSTFGVPPNTRSTVDVNQAVGPGVSVGMHVHSGVPILAERPMYARDYPSSTLLSVPWRSQKYPLSCEAAALQMILEYRGYQHSQDEIMAVFGDDSSPPQFDGSGHLLHWGDPYNAFVGSVNGSMQNFSGFGIKFPPAQRAAIQLGPGARRAGEGMAASDLYTDILMGHPAMVWIAADYTTHGMSHYSAYDGRAVTWGWWFEHVVPIVGVTADSVAILDELRSPGPIWMSRAQFEATWAQFGNMAVVLN